MPPAPHQYERMLPQPGAQLIINLYENQTRVYSDDAQRRCLRSSGSVLGGPQLCSQVIDTAEQIRVMGVVFRPVGAGALTGADMSALDGRDVDLADLFGHHVGALRQRLLETAQPLRRLALLEQWLCRRMRLPCVEPCVAHALAWLERTPHAARVGGLVRETGVSEKRLTRLFRRQVGYGPKSYARLLRFRAVVAQMHGLPGSWPGAAPTPTTWHSMGRAKIYKTAICPRPGFQAPTQENRDEPRTQHHHPLPALPRCPRDDRLAVRRVRLREACGV